MTPRTERRRAILIFALGRDQADLHIADATEAYGSEAFAIDYIFGIVRRWVEGQPEHGRPEEAIREITDLVSAMSARIDQLTEGLAECHARELEEAKRRGHR